MSLEKYIVNHRYTEIGNRQCSRKTRGEKEAEQLGLRGIASMLQMGIQPEKREQERNDMGESVFQETDPISLFWGLLMYLLLHIGMNTESRGGQQS